MFYKQNFDNSYDFDPRKNNNDKNEKRDRQKGICTVKVIQECCYPSYFDYEDKKDDNQNNYCYQQDKQFDGFNYDNNDKKDDCYKKEEHNCCCKKEDKWEEKNTCHNHDKYNNKCSCRQRNSCCGFCSCFRRW